MPTWRMPASVPATARRSASRAVSPAASAASTAGPVSGSGTDWTATAPTPACAKGTTEPTENQCDWTATPSSSVSGSRATIEYVPWRAIGRAYGMLGSVRAMATQIALLRGINLGSRNRVPMPELREHLAQLGYGDVRTVVQSGNLVLHSSAGARQLAADLQAAIADRFGVDTPVVVRTAPQLEKVVAANPFPDAAADPKRYQVSFLASACTAAEARALREADVAPEQLHVAGREIYVWHVNGIQKSPAAKLLARSCRVSPPRATGTRCSSCSS